LRIDGEINELGRPIIPAIVDIPSIDILGTVDFLVDTGSYRTLLSLPDVKELGINYKVLPKGENAQGVGSSSTKILQETTVLTFDTNFDYYPIQFQFDEMVILMRNIPSLLGRDVIREFTLTFNDKEVYLKTTWMSDLKQFLRL